MGILKNLLALTPWILSLGKTMMENWKVESESEFNEALPTPEKRGINAEMAKVNLLEAEAKRRRLELQVAAQMS